MSLRESIRQVMTEVGPIADFHAVDPFPSEDLWHITVDEATTLFAELAPSRDVLVLSADLGKPVAQDRKAFYELLLRYAHVWDTTGGLRMSLDAADGAVWLLLDCPASDMTVADLSRYVADFAGKVRVWREIVGTEPRVLAEAGRMDAMLDPGFIRG
jgi:hypothetical protein